MVAVTPTAARLTRHAQRLGVSGRGLTSDDWVAGRYQWFDDHASCTSPGVDLGCTFAEAKRQLTEIAVEKGIG